MTRWRRWRAPAWTSARSRRRAGVWSWRRERHDSSSPRARRRADLRRGGAADVGIVGKDVLAERCARRLRAGRPRLRPLPDGLRDRARARTRRPPCSSTWAPCASRPSTPGSRPLLHRHRPPGRGREGQRLGRARARWWGSPTASSTSSPPARTLRDNGLVEREEILASSARLIANRVSHKVRGGAHRRPADRLAAGGARERAPRLRLAGDGVDELVAAPCAPTPPVEGRARASRRRLDDVRELGDDAIVDDARAFDCAGLRRRPPARAPRRSTGRPSGSGRPARGHRGRGDPGAGRGARRGFRATGPGAWRTASGCGCARFRWPPAGCYVPGGRAAYPSTLVMAVVPAQVAGVERVAVVSPPGPGRPALRRDLGDGLPAGRGGGLRRGGACRPIGALAFGTATIPPVDVIAGPGNPWVQEAKRQVVGAVGRRRVSAGPSEVLAIADAAADPRRDRPRPARPGRARRRIRPPSSSARTRSCWTRSRRRSGGRRRGRRP